MDTFSWNDMQNWVSHHLVITISTLYAVSIIVGILLLYFIVKFKKRGAPHNRYFDPFTKLPNRGYFHAHLSDLIEKSDTSWLAVGFVDLDRFAIINDLYGYTYGNAILRQFVEKFRHALRDDMELFRVGGDEFALIIHNPASIPYLELICRELTTYVPLDKHHELTTTCSIGISYYPDQAKTSRELLRIAKVATSEAQKRGGGQVFMYDEKLGQEQMHKLEMEQAMQKALQRNEFTLHYQPQFDLQTEQFCGMEALIRWNSPKYGTVSPLTFIPIAEETGFIIELGYWIIEQVCQQIAEWQRTMQTSHKVSINLSPRQLLDTRFYSYVEQLIQRYDIDAQLLSFEITETTAVENLHETNIILKKLSQLGSSIAIDDFGTGYSSLSMLNNLHCHHLKIDRSFVNNFTKDKDSLAIIEAVITIAHHFNMAVIAEGVETEEQLAQLRSIGCDVVQGYLISRPVASSEVSETMSNWLSRSFIAIN